MVARSRVLAPRLVAHLAAWIPFAIGAIRAVQRGGPLTGDAAAIALRSWDVLTPYGPLVGQATMLHNGAFDPGPLQYWLLVIPVHMDPLEGAAWGGALWCMVAASLTIEAAWSALGARGGLAACAVILGLVVWQPLVPAQPYWNPWLGMMFFLATLAAGFAVMSGRHWWWPVLVVTASVAVQAHLMFALASAALVLLALAAGFADTIRAEAGHFWWVAVGLVLGAACWIAPFIQQFTSRIGNLSLLIGSLGVRQPVGLTYGWKALAAAAGPPPLWFGSAQWFRTEGIESVIGGRSGAPGLVVLALTAVALVAAIWPLRSRRLAILAAISLLTSVAVLVTYSGIPAHSINVRAQNYLLIVLYPAGVLAWLAIGSAVVLAARRVIHPARVLAAARGEHREPGTAATPAGRWAVPAADFATIALIGLGSWLGVAQQARAYADSILAEDVAATSQATQAIERLVPAQRVEIRVVEPDGTYAREVTLGLAWALQAAGYQPAVRQRAARFLGPRYLYRGRPMPRVTVVEQHKIRLHLTLSTGPQQSRSA